MEAKLQVGILGLGTVGSGVIHILEKHQEKISQITGYHIHVKKALIRDVKKKRNCETKNFTLVTNPDEIINDPEIAVIIEVIGGTEIAKDYILRSLKSGKSVVTANKDLIAFYGDELVTIAQKNRCDLFYEASVAGGIPILRTIVNSLAADRIQKVMGVVNGTTNFMLTKMATEQKTYDEVLEEAQEAGFAEADPTSDVDGLDAARKMVILTRLAFGMNVNLADVETKGIRGIDSKDIEMSYQLGYKIKLIGKSEEKKGTVSVEVGPMLIPRSHPLSGVSNENNAVFVTGRAVGETMFYGPGAGDLPPATSVVSDLITVAKNRRLGTTGSVFNNFKHETKYTPKEQVFARYYLRLEMNDQVGNFLKLTQIFAKEGISFAKILQEPLNDNVATVVIVTHKTSKAQIEEIVNKIEDENEIHLTTKYVVVEG